MIVVSAVGRLITEAIAELARELAGLVARGIVVDPSVEAVERAALEHADKQHDNDTITAIPMGERADLIRASRVML